MFRGTFNQKNSYFKAGLLMDVIRQRLKQTEV